MKNIILSITLVFAILTNAQNFNKENSIIEFLVGEKVEGYLNFHNAEYKFDEKDLKNSYFKIEIDPSTINTASNKRDKHLQKKTFFNVEMYPMIKFESTKVYKKKGLYYVDGKLNMKGIEKEISFEFKIKTDENDIKYLEGTYDFQRLDYQLGESYKKDGMVPYSVKTIIKFYYNSES